MGLVLLGSWLGYARAQSMNARRASLHFMWIFLFQINTETLPTGPPLPIVVITIAIRHEPYIIADTNGNPTAWVSVQINAAVYINLSSRHDQCIIYLVLYSCWLSPVHGTRFAFIGPMLLILLVWLHVCWCLTMIVL